MVDIFPFQSFNIIIWLGKIQINALIFMEGMKTLSLQTYYAILEFHKDRNLFCTNVIIIFCGITNTLSDATYFGEDSNICEGN